MAPTSAGPPDGAASGPRQQLDRLWELLARFRWTEFAEGLQALSRNQSESATGPELDLLQAWEGALRRWEFGPFRVRAGEIYRQAVADADWETAARAIDLRASALTADCVAGRLGPDAVAEAQRVLQEAIGWTTSWPRPDPLIRLIRKLGQVHLQTTPPNQAEARNCFQAAAELASRAGLPVLEADTLLQRAELDFPGELAAGLQRPGFGWQFPSFEEAFQLYQEAGHRRGMADTRLRLGACLVDAGLDGRSLLHEALGLYQADGDPLGVFQVLSKLTFANRIQGDLLAARQESDRLAALAQQLQVPILKTTEAMGRSELAFATGNIDRALAHLDPDPDNLPVSAALSELLHLNMAGRPPGSTLAWAGDLPPRGRSTEYLIRANRAAQHRLWDEALRIAEEGVRFDTERGWWWEAFSKIALAVMAVLMGRRQPDGTFPTHAIDEARTRLGQAFELFRPPEDGNQYEAVAELHDLAAYVSLLAKDPARALYHATASLGVYKTLGRRMRQAFASAQLGLIYHSLAQSDAALYEAAIERYSEAISYFRQQDVRTEVWRVSALLAQALFRSPVARQFLPGDPERGIKAALAVLEEAYSLYNQVRRRFIPADAERPDPGIRVPLRPPEETPALCVSLAFFARQPTASWSWAERFKSRAFLDDLARTPLRPPEAVPEELLTQEKELLHILNGPGTLTEKVQAADLLHVLYGRWAADGLGEEYRSLRLGEPAAWATVQSLLSDPAGGVLTER